MMNASKKIFALEGEWNSRLAHTESVLPALQFLQQSQSIEFVHRRVAIKEALFDYLDLAVSARMKYPIIYLGFHGKRGYLYPKPESKKIESISIEELRVRYAGKFKGKFVHFGSCDTINVGNEKIQLFLEETQAELVSGYTKSIGFVESMLLDMAYFYRLQNFEEIKNFHNKMPNWYPGLCKRLGFVIHRLDK